MKFPISLIIITYNTSNYVEECLNSVFNQTLDYFETIIVDNASTDGTAEIIERCIKDKPNIKFIKNPKNLGGAAAGNLGIKKAKGEYVFLMDSDDVLPQNSLKALYFAAKKEKAHVCIGRGKSFIDNEIVNLKFKFDSLTWCRPKVVKVFSAKDTIAFAPYYWGRIYKRSFLLRCRIFMVKGSINADRYFNLKSLKHSKKTVVIDELCYLWRRQSGESYKSVSQQNNNISNFKDKMQSTKKIDNLFKFYRTSYRFIRLCSALRLLVIAKQLKPDTEFFDFYFKSLREYLSDLSLSELCEFPYMSARRKLLCYFIKENRPNDFMKFIDPQTSIPRKYDGNFYSLELEGYLNENIPDFVLRQKRWGIKSFNFSKIVDKEDYYLIKCKVGVWEGADFEPLRCTLLGQFGEEKAIIKAKAKEQSENKIPLNVKIPKNIVNKLERGEYRIQLEYILNDNFNSKDLCYRKAPATLIVADDKITIFNGDSNV